MTVRMPLRNCKMLIVFILLSFSSFSQSITNLPALEGILNFARVSESNNLAVVGGLETYYSLDNGFTWLEFDDSFGTSVLYPYETYDAAIVNGTTVFLIARDVFTDSWAVLSTTNLGVSWTEHVVSAPSPTQLYNSIEYNGSSIIVTTEGGVFQSLNLGATWNFVSISGGAEISAALTHNTISNDWLVDSYSGVDFNTSTNNGNSWSNNTVPGYLSTNTNSASSQSGDYLITQEVATNSVMLHLNQSLALTNAITIPNSNLESNSSLRNSFFLANGDIFNHNELGFYTIGTSNNFVYYHNHTLIQSNTSSSPINDMDLGITYGIAVGNFGAISRIDLLQPSDEYVPANIVVSQPANCPGGVLIAENELPFADSLQWYLNGSYISSDSLLQYTVPSNFGTYTLELRSWVDGSYVSDSYTLNLPQPLNPHPFNYNASTNNVCYGEPININFFSLPTTNSETLLEIYLGGTLINGPQLLPTSNFTFSTPPIVQNDILQIITSRPQLCGTPADTIELTVTVGPNLEAFTINTLDSVMCTGSSFDYVLNNTIQGATYEFNQTQSWSSGTFTSSNIGNGTNTLMFNFDIPAVNNSQNPFYMGNFFRYYNLEVSLNGCQVTTTISDTIRIQRSTALFYLESASVYNSDTVPLLNAFSVDNRQWSVSGLTPTEVTDITDTVPTIFTNKTGFYPIELANEPLPGCTDTMERILHICEPTPLNEMTICDTNTLNTGGRISKVEKDAEGNLYIAGIEHGVFDVNPHWYFTKYDNQGVLQWRKEAPPVPTINHAAVIESFDFDENGDIYVVSWIYGELTHNTPYGNHPSITSPESYCYLSKVDPATGDAYWNVFLNQQVAIGANDWKPADVVYDDNKVYVSLLKNDAIMMFALDANGNYIANSISGTGAMPGNFQNYFLFGGGSCGNGRESKLSPQIEVLSSGEVVGIAEYQNMPPTSPIYPQLASSAETAIMGFKYTVQDGLHNFVKVAETGDEIGCVSTKHPILHVDGNDDLILGFTFTEGLVTIDGAVQNYPPGSLLFKTDTSFSLNWVSHSPNSVFTSIDVAKGTNEIIAGFARRNNFSIGTDSVHRMAGTYYGYPTEYGTNPYQWQANLFSTDKFGWFMTRLDENGQAQSVASWYTTNPVNATALPVLQGVTDPCGNISVLFNNAYLHNFDTVDVVYESTLGDYAITQCLEYKIDAACATGLCSALSLQDTVFLCSGNTDISVSYANVVNVDSVYYIFNEQGNNLDSGWYYLGGGSIDLILPSSVQGNSLSLFFSGAIQDTTYIELVQNPVSTFTYQDTVCISDSLVVFGDQPSMTYYYALNGTFITQDDTLNVLASQHLPGWNQIVIEQEGPEGCIDLDTLDYFASTGIVPTFAPTYELFCGDSLIVPFNSSEYTNVEFIVNGNSYSNYFDSLNLDVGINNITFQATDINGCTSSGSFVIYYCTDLGISTTDFGQLVVLPNPSKGDFTIKLPQESTYVLASVQSLEGKILKTVASYNSIAVLIQLSLPSGMYLLEVFADFGHYSQRIIIMN